MAKGTRQHDDLCTMLRRHLGQRTVLGVAIPVLAGHIAAAKTSDSFAGLTEREIQMGYRELAGKYIKSDYHSTYVQRPLGRRGFLELVGGRYRLRPTLTDGPSLAELERLHADLVASLKNAREQRETAIRRLQQTCELPHDCIAERRALVDAYLSQLTGNRGEMFEVVSFAVLREYFRTFGFSLQRFSTTHANDGGMDFVASEAIYQVTVDESAQKVRKDLRKAPGTKRVLVRPTAVPEVAALCGEDVLEIIELKDLLSHFVAWLLGRDARANRAMHLQQILLIALDEFRRENKAEAGMREQANVAD